MEKLDKTKVFIKISLLNWILCIQIMPKINQLNHIHTTVLHFFENDNTLAHISGTNIHTYQLFTTQIPTFIHFFALQIFTFC